MRKVAVLLLVLTLALVASVQAVQAEAQPLRPELYWRVDKYGRPGDELTVAFFLGTVDPSGVPKPVPDARYQASLRGSRDPVVVEVRGGIAYARVRVPLEMLLGGVITLNLTASSELHGITRSTTVTVRVEPDLAALGVLSSLAIPFLVVLVYAGVRRR